MMLTPRKKPDLTGKRKKERTESYRSPFSIGGKKVRIPLEVTP